MTHRLVAVAAVGLALGGCLRRTSYSACKQATDCSAAGAGARCEPNGACSLPDPSCPSGYRYHSSAPAGDACVAGGSIDAPQTDGPPTDGPPLPPPGRECVQGSPLPAGYSTCAGLVDAKEARCGTEMWDNVCVAIAEQTCQLSCAGMAFIGTDDTPFVIRLADDHVLWRDTGNATDGGVGAWADYDNDGDPDLAVAGTNVIRVFKNSGYAGDTLTMTQVFSVTWPGTPPMSPWLNAKDVKWVDYDNDGDVDIAISGDDAVLLIRNDGDDVFIQDTTIFRTFNADDSAPILAMGQRMAWGDYDGDGWPDLAFGRFGHPIMVWHNDHGGSFTDTNWLPDATSFNPNYGGGVEWCNVDAGNVAGDPEPELVAAGYSYVAIADNSNKMLVNAWTVLDGNRSGSDVHCADLDGDGDLDLAVSGGDTNPARIYRNGNRTVGGFAQTWSDPTTQGGLNDTFSGAVGDLDGDHKLDFIEAGYNNAPSINFQRFHNVTTTSNNPQFGALPPRDVLSAEMQGQRPMRLAPLLGK